VLLKLTPKGRRIVQQAVVGFSAAIQAFRQELDVDEPELLRHLEAMSAALERAIAADQNARVATS
jgi:hypothetical protein